MPSTHQRSNGILDIISYKKVLQQKPLLPLSDTIVLLIASYIYLSNMQLPLMVNNEAHISQLCISRTRIERTEFYFSRVTYFSTFKLFLICINNNSKLIGTIIMTIIAEPIFMYPK